ncbi:MAG: META domain-containing protein [Saprospiraceae bacterium]
MRNFLITIALAAIFGSYACTDKTVVASIDNTSWQLKKIVEGTTTQIPPAGVKTTANFNAGKITGNGGCNTYNGSYVLSGNRLTFGSDVISTKMFCQAANDWEMRYFHALHGELQWKISGNTLTLQGVEMSLVFEKQ